MAVEKAFRIVDRSMCCHACLIFEMPIRKVKDIISVFSTNDKLIAPEFFGALKIHFPDLHGEIFLSLGIMQMPVYPSSTRLVESTNTICCE